MRCKVCGKHIVKLHSYYSTYLAVVQHWDEVLCLYCNAWYERIVHNGNWA